MAMLGLTSPVGAELLPRARSAQAAGKDFEEGPSGPSFPDQEFQKVPLKFCFTGLALSRHGSVHAIHSIRLCLVLHQAKLEHSRSKVLVLKIAPVSHQCSCCGHPVSSQLVDICVLRERLLITTLP